MRWSLAFVASLSLTAYAGSPPQPAPAAPAATPTAAPAGEARRSGVLLGNFDQRVRPQDDLYRYVNGTWLAKTEIPADKSNYGAATRLQDEVEKNLKAILQEAVAAGAKPGSDTQLIGDFYASFMDDARAEQLGLAPLGPEFARIAAIEDRGMLLDYLAHAGRVGIATPLRAGIRPDAKRPDVYTRLHGPGRPRDAGPRLLPEGRRALRRVPCPVPRLRHRRAGDGGPQGRRGCRAPRAGLRDAPGPGVVAASRPARPEQDLQPVRPRRRDQGCRRASTGIAISRASASRASSS